MTTLKNRIVILTNAAATSNKNNSSFTYKGQPFSFMSQLYTYGDRK